MKKITRTITYVNNRVTVYNTNTKEVEIITVKTFGEKNIDKEIAAKLPFTYKMIEYIPESACTTTRAMSVERFLENSVEV